MKRTKQSFVVNEPLLNSLDGERKGLQLAPLDVPDQPTTDIPDHLLRKGPLPIPSVSEVQVVRHFTRLSKLNYCIDDGIYPLGSCTMKYNPRINEDVAALPAFNAIHPYSPEQDVQGALAMMYRLKQAFLAITGLADCTLAPSAGAHGELAGTLLMRAYCEHHGLKRRKVLVPDTAHGTNPSSAHLAGFKAKQVKSSPAGYLDPEAVRAALSEDIAGMMITNPNTLGIFETGIREIADMLHANNSLLYIDGANLNALLGRARFADMGADIIHMNLHKTFSTPHGGGGPGAGPVCVSDRVKDFLPIPYVAYDEAANRYFMSEERPHTIGRMRSFYGNFLVLLRACVYVLRLGHKGLKQVSGYATLNANYLKHLLKGAFHLPYDTDTLHEAVFSHKFQRTHDVKVADIAKRLIDKGFHPPTISFPLVVHGAPMIEPTETECKAELDAFAQALIEIARESETEPQTIQHAPTRTPVGRLDEVKAVKEPKLTWKQL